MMTEPLNLQGGSAKLPSRPAVHGPILVGVCGGKQPRIGVTIPKDLFSVVGGALSRATVQIATDGTLRVSFGAAGRGVTIRPNGDAYVQVPTSEVPGVTTTRISRKKISAMTVGNTVVTTRPLAEGFFATGKPPVQPATVDDLRARLDWLNDQIAARRARGAPVDVAIEGGRITLEIVDRVKL